MPEREKTAAEALAAELKPKERRFVEELLVDLNGTRAAIRAGYSERTAASQASRLLRRPGVKAYRDALLQEQFEAIGVTRHSLAAETWNIYQKCTEKVPVLEWDSSTHEYVETGLWQFDSKGALKALDLLSKMLPDMAAAPEEDDGESIEDMIED